MKKKLLTDPIVEEVRRNRENLLKEYHGNIDKLCRDARKHAARLGLKIVKAPAPTPGRRTSGKG